MRQRLFNRGRAATMSSTAPSTNTPTRSRSATSPISSTQPDFTWDSTTATRYYHFTDEPGYFRPSSPFINRQEVDEDLEDNVKHACGLLVESIERGLPIWPSFHTQPIPTQNPMTQLSLSPVALDTLVPVSDPTTDTDTADYGTGTSLSLQSPPPKPSSYSYGNSFSMSASANTGRFYGRRLSSSPLEEPEYEPESRARGRSFATDSTSPRSRSRSRSSSPGFFPYSPPQMDTAWGRDNTQIFETPDESLFPTGDAFLGAEGITWLRASLDMQSEQHTDTETDRKVAPGPAPRRFYSVRQAKKDPLQWDTVEVHGSRESGIYRGLSMRDLSMDEERKRANGASYSVGEGISDSEDVCAPQGFYSLLSDEVPVRHRRKRASELLKKLAGLGMRRKEEGRRVETM